MVDAGLEAFGGRDDLRAGLDARPGDGLLFGGREVIVGRIDVRHAEEDVLYAVGVIVRRREGDLLDGVGGGAGDQIVEGEFGEAAGLVGGADGAEAHARRQIAGRVEGVRREGVGHDARPRMPLFVQNEILSSADGDGARVVVVGESDVV